MSSLCYATTITSIKSINNMSTSEDYKISTQRLDDIGTLIKPTSNLTEVFNYSDTKNLDSLSKEESYLISNNIITREPVSITANDSKIIIGQAVKKDSTVPIKKSEFLMSLYKSKFGILESRPIVLNTKATRVIDNNITQVNTLENYQPVGSNSSKISVDFSEGDYNVYISPSVYELYFTELLNKGLLTKGEFKDKSFISEYEAIGSSNNSKILYPTWHSKLSSYSPKVIDGNSLTNFFSIIRSLPLGRSYSIDNYDLSTGKVSSDFVLKHTTPDYFVSEKTSTIEGLRYIEKLLRLTEKDMTNTESKIVTYKYGVSYINKMPDNDRKTVMFLLSKGILNFEVRSEFGEIYSDLSYDFMCTLLYRVSNPNARFDFSKIQLTDSDNFWLEQGFSQDVIKFYDTDKLPIAMTISAGEDVIVSTSEKKSLFSRVLAFIGVKEKITDSKYASPNDTLKDWYVIKTFSSGTKYSYKGTLLSSITESSPLDDVTREKGIDANFMTFKFKVSSNTMSNAIAQLDSRITIGVLGTLSGSIGSITKVDVDGRQLTFVSATQLKTLSSDIQITEDKVLRNVKTGATAILLPEAQMALVGNEVITTKDLMVFGINKEIYYNLDIIMSIMSNAFLSTIDNNIIFLCDTVLTQKLVPVISSTGSLIESNDLGFVKGVPVDGGEVEDKIMYNLTAMSRGLTALIKDYSYSDPNTHLLKQAKLLINWTYVLPESSVGFTGIIDKENPTIKEMSDFLFTRPAENSGDLVRWWDSNIELSNNLTNIVFGTTGVSYFKSGYFSPSITLLCEDSKDVERIKKDLISKSKFSGQYITKFINGSSDFISALFNKTETSSVYNQMSMSRIFESPEATNISGGLVFAGKYYISNAHSVYVDVMQDDRISYSNDSLKIKTRTKDQIDPYVGTPVKFNDKDYTVLSLFAPTAEQKSDGGRYIALVAREAVWGTVTEGNSGLVLGGNSVVTPNTVSNDIITEYIEYLTKSLAKDSYWIPKDRSMLSGTPYKVFLNDGYTLIGQSLYDVKFGNIEKTTLDYIMDTIKDDFQNTPYFYAYPVIYLDANKYQIDKGTVVTRQTSPYLKAGNIFYSGINSSMVDSILAKFMSLKDVSELKTGDKLIIGDTLFEVSGGRLNSYPISGTTFNNIVAQNPGDTNNIDSAVQKLYLGVNLDFSGRSQNFGSYIKTGSYISSPTDGAKMDNTLYIDKGVLKIKKDGQVSNFVKPTVPTSSCVSISLQNGLRCRPVDSSNNLYVLVMSSNTYGEGSVNNIPFFKESLNIGLRDDMFIGISRAKFQPLQEAVELRNKFLNDYKKAIKGDIKAILKLLAVTVISYLILMSFLCFPVTNLGLGLPILLALKNPLKDSTSKEGFDLIKMISLGMYRMEERIAVSRLIFGNLFLFCILYVVIDKL